jgi:TetR/AcrR family transcriptional regulator, ethionamide resistance regulator
VAAMTEILGRTDMPADGPGSAPEVARALCWMTERTFYRAYVEGAHVEGARGAALTHVGDVCIGIWLAVLPAAE